MVLNEKELSIPDPTSGPMIPVSQLSASPSLTSPPSSLPLPPLPSHPLSPSPQRISRSSFMEEENSLKESSWNPLTLSLPSQEIKRPSLLCTPLSKSSLKILESDEVSLSLPWIHKKPFKTLVLHALILISFSIYFAFAMVIHSSDPSKQNYSGLLILLYAFVSSKLFFEHVSTRVITLPLSILWKKMFLLPLSQIPTKIRKWTLYGIPLVMVVALVLTFEESPTGTRLQRLHSMLGLCGIIGILWATSTVSFFGGFKND